jgi:hypothetical protein
MTMVSADKVEYEIVELTVFKVRCFFGKRDRPKLMPGASRVTRQSPATIILRFRVVTVSLCKEFIQMLSCGIQHDLKTLIAFSEIVQFGGAYQSGADFVRKSATGYEIRGELYHAAYVIRKRNGNGQ